MELDLARFWIKKDQTLQNPHPSSSSVSGGLFFDKIIAASGTNIIPMIPRSKDIVDFDGQVRVVVATRVF